MVVRIISVEPAWSAPRRFLPLKSQDRGPRRYSGSVRKRPARTWAEVGVANAGVRGAVHAFTFAMGWGLATAELGREPESVDEYARIMEVSRAKAFRDQQDFRKAFPSQETPYAFNVKTGAQARYDEAYDRLKDIAKARKEVEPLVLTLGARLAPG